MCFPEKQQLQLQLKLHVILTIYTVMAVVKETSLGWLLDHNLLLNRWHGSVNQNDEHSINGIMNSTGTHESSSGTVGYESDSRLFAINSAFLRKNQLGKCSQQANGDPAEFMTCLREVPVARDPSLYAFADRKGQADNTWDPVSNSTVCRLSSLVGDEEVINSTGLESKQHVNLGIDVASAHGGLCQDKKMCLQKGKLHKKARRKRKVPLNSGEEAALEYHDKIKGFLLQAMEQLMNYVKGNEFSLTRESLYHQQEESVVLVPHKQADFNSRSVHESDLGALPAVVDCLVTYTGTRPCLAWWLGSEFIIPANSSFLLSDFSRLEPLLSRRKKYDLVVMDPPWENKSVKRMKTYGTLTDWDLYKIPVCRLCAPGSLVAVWVTNKQKQIRFVKEELFLHWNVQYIATWHWLKVTTQGEPVCNIESEHKKPYEHLIIGICTSQNRVRHRKMLAGNGTGIRKTDNGMEVTKCDIEMEVNRIGVAESGIGGTDGSIGVGDTGIEVTDNGIGMAHSGMEVAHSGIELADANRKAVDQAMRFPDRCSAPTGSRTRDKCSPCANIPDHQVLVSVPCSIHSRKPPLSEVLRKYVAPGSQCLEMFARNLVPGWTCWGNDVLKFQHVDYFVKKPLEVKQDDHARIEESTKS
ncbi:PREDICTED: methyltransferase-like protein 4 isoform X2 [Priapulus caudatus]|uniref:Methyltransferase-like protein 4 isoform X2 n=1 Tax=Priapulus caudatus TaxID=37621 RepID=A0ABM1E570_PRICU|nr:PREDICTED: methyltransferase-like protein 4 isoform X2 [Priapulus caudatus]